ESPCFDAQPSDSAYLAAGEIRRPSRPLARQSQTAESRAGSDNAGRGKLSRSLGEVVLQRSFAAFSRRQISLPIPRPSKVYLSVGTNRRHFPHCSFATTSDRFHSCC